MMRTRTQPGTAAALRITFERPGEEPATIVVTDGKRAVLRAVSILIAYRELQDGDCLRVTAAE